MAPRESLHQHELGADVILGAGVERIDFRNRNRGLLADVLHRCNFAQQFVNIFIFPRNPCNTTPSSLGRISSLRDGWKTLIGGEKEDEDFMISSFCQLAPISARPF